MENNQENIRESVSRSESSFDLPVSLKDRMDFNDDFDIFSPGQLGQASSFTQEALRMLNTESVGDYSSTGRSCNTMNALERQIYARGRLENITEEESCDLDNSKMTDRYRSINVLENAVEGMSTKIGVQQYASLRVIGNAPGSNDKRKCQLAHSTNVLEIEQYFSEDVKARMDFSKFEPSPLADRKVFVNLLEKDKGADLSHLYKNDPSHVDIPEEEILATNSPYNNSFSKSPFHKYINISQKPSIVELAEQQGVNDNFNSFGKEVVDIANFEVSSSYGNDQRPPKTLDEKIASYRSLNDLEGQSNLSTRNDSYMKASSVYLESRRNLTVNTNDNQIGASVYSNESKILSRNPKERARVGPTETSRYDFAKKAKPFKEESFNRANKSVKNIKAYLKELPKVTSNVKSELFKSRIPKIEPTDRSERSWGSLEHRSIRFSKVGNVNFDL
jgi:hypothetical protein